MVVADVYFNPACLEIMPNFFGVSPVLKRDNRRSIAGRRVDVKSLGCQALAKPMGQADRVAFNIGDANPVNILQRRIEVIDGAE